MHSYFTPYTDETILSGTKMRAVRPHLILFSSDEQTNQQANTRGDGNCREGIIFYIITYNIRRLLGSLTTLCSDFTGSTFT